MIHEGLANLQIYGFANLGTSIPVSQPQFSAQFESSQPNFTSPDSPISMWPRERWLEPEISLEPGRAEYEKKGHPVVGNPGDVVSFQYQFSEVPETHKLEQVDNPSLDHQRTYVSPSPNLIIGSFQDRRYDRRDWKWRGCAEGRSSFFLYHTPGVIDIPMSPNRIFNPLKLQTMKGDWRDWLIESVIRLVSRLYPHSLLKFEPSSSPQPRRLQTHPQPPQLADHLRTRNSAKKRGLCQALVPWNPRRPSLCPNFAIPWIPAQRCRGNLCPLHFAWEQGFQSPSELRELCDLRQGVPNSRRGHSRAICSKRGATRGRSHQVPHSHALLHGDRSTRGPARCHWRARKASPFEHGKALVHRYSWTPL